MSSEEIDATVPTEALWRPAQVAARLECAVSTVYVWMRTGELRSVVTRQPGSVRTLAMVPESAVRELQKVLASR